jgi:uncharacterized protein (DUF1501 family)
MTHRNCEGVTRRSCLQLGLGGLLGGGFVGALRAVGAERAGGSADAPAKSVILVWLDGGPSHYETFDPKPEAPAEVRGEFDAIRTAVPGVLFSKHCTSLAASLDKFAIVRSIRHDQGNHGAGNHYMMTGAPPRMPVGCGAFVSFHPSMGSAVASERSAPLGLPSYFSMPRMSRSGGPNFLGAKYAPFVVSDNPASKGFKVRDVALPDGLSTDRFTNRTDLRQLVDKLPRINEPAAGDPVPALDGFYEQGFDLVTSTEAQAAFDVAAEPDKVRDAYGRSSFGQRALLARRLVEAGVPFITLYEGGWDDHRGLFAAFDKKLPPLESTVAALIADLEDRGMLDSTLVVVLGEFGRTPKVNKDAGRDHWSNAMSVLMAGARIPGGTIVGATDRAGYSAVDDVKSPENFVSTVYRKLGIDPGQILHTPQGRPVHLVSDPEPIQELM